jgi:predicted transcriptional regulator
MMTSERLFDPVQFGLNLAAVLDKKDMSLRQAGAAIGVGYNTVYRVIHGMEPRAEVYLRINRWVAGQSKKKARR